MYLNLYVRILNTLFVCVCFLDKESLLYYCTSTCYGVSFVTVVGDIQHMDCECQTGRKSGGCRRCLSPLVALGSALLCGPVERRLLCNPPSSIQPVKGARHTTLLLQQLHL